MKIMSQFMYMYQKEDLLLNPLRFGLLEAGNCIVANNNSKIPAKGLNNILWTIASNHFFIVSKWKEIHDEEEVKYYC